MSDQYQQFQNLWEFSRMETDWELLNNDDHARPSSASDPKSELETIQFPGTENAQQTLHNPTSHPSGETENQSTLEEPNRKPNQPDRTVKRNAQTKRTKGATSNHVHEPTDAALLALKEHMESLVEEVKITGEKMIAWMVSKLKSPSNNNGIVLSKPSWVRKGQRNNMRRSRIPEYNPTSRKRKLGTVMKSSEDGSSGSRSPQTIEDVVLPKEGEDVVIDTSKGIKNEKQKGKASSSSIKKRKSVGPEAVRWTDAGHLTMPSALPQKQADNSEELLLENVNLSEFGSMNSLNSRANLSSHLLNTDPRVMQNDHLTLPAALPQKQAESIEEMLLESVNLLDFGRINAPNPRVNLRSSQLNTDPQVITQTGLMNNVSGYEQSTTGLAMSNGIGNAFPFPLVPQGSSLETGVRKILNPFTLQYLTQRTMVSGMYREPLGFSSRNHAFMGSYSALNQNLNYNAQQGGVVMSLHSQDMTRGASNQGIP